MRARRERDAIRRRARRARGFTLVELMVVVVLVSILALLATPLMRTSRDDRLAFDLARRIEQLWSRAQIRASGHGSHLFVAAPSGATRGKFLLFESFDNTAAPLGPAPRTGCKGNLQWQDAITWVPGMVSGNIKFVDGFDQGTLTGAVVDADIRTNYAVNGAAFGALVMCVTGPTVWVGRGATFNGAVTDLNTQVLPFSGTAEITVTRNQGGLPIGLRRVVRKAGNGAAMVYSK